MRDLELRDEHLHGILEQIPTKQQIIDLPKGKYYITRIPCPQTQQIREEAWIGAETIGRRLLFECPWCRSRYKKNGQPYVNAKREKHGHGWTTQTPIPTISQLVGTWQPKSKHCFYNSPWLPRSYNVMITPYTKYNFRN